MRRLPALLLIAAPLAAQDTQIPDAIMGRAGALQGENVAYFDGDAGARGYLAVPEGDGPFPAVILVHEWNGLVDRVREVADAFAEQGYVALAADLYSGQTGSSREENIRLMRAASNDMDMVIANLNSAQEFLESRSDVTGRIGVMGWCFGGGIALSYGLGGDEHEATAIFYGRLIEDPEVLRSLTHPVYGTFGALDRGPPPEQVRAFAGALESIGIESDIHIYDGVGHGFWLWVDQDPENREVPAADAWSRLLAYLDRTLRR